MKSATRLRHHRRFGLIAGLILCFFCLSGLVLNHREAVSGVDVSRRVLPGRYAFERWNNGLLRGTLPLPASNAEGGEMKHTGERRRPLHIDSRESAGKNVCAEEADQDEAGTDIGKPAVGKGAPGRVLIYGAAGIWTADARGRNVHDFNDGLPAASDRRRTIAVVASPGGELFSACTYGLYRRRLPGPWRPVDLTLQPGDRPSDLYIKGDTLLVVGRSYVYLSTDRQHLHFRALRLPASPDADLRPTLFRTIWMLHSGELFGTAGRLVVDAVALILLFLFVSGIAAWVCRRRHPAPRLLHADLHWHNRVGRLTIFLTLFVVATGWALRPPLLILLAQWRAPAPPFTALHASNPWHDRLRAIRYDDRCGDWLLSTSEGFFAMRTLTDLPRRIPDAPPVSVMGLNVWQRDAAGRWLCGSFSGLYRWERGKNGSGHPGHITDYFTGRVASTKPGPPFGRYAVAGYSADFAVPPFAVLYDEGTTAIPQPAALRNSPMSLWAVALELHTGRLLFGNSATWFYVFLAGPAIAYTILTGRSWRRRRRGVRPQRQAPAERP